MNKKRAISIFLPQYHPIPENDQWWGKGFTEWTNVTKARPLFEGHYQPHLPADLGFYDLRLKEARQAQAELAKQYGIHGFCYYHYWFNGQRLLERPVEDNLNSGEPDFPFMLCWANENWTRRWDGLEKEVLMGQHYSDEDDIAHIRYLLKYFKDPRYIRVNSKPVFVVYKAFLLPDPTATVKRWRAIAAEEGMELYLCHMVFCYDKSCKELIDGFDAVIDFEPFGVRRKSVFEEINNRRKRKLTLYDRVKLKLFRMAGVNAKISRINKKQSSLNRISYRWMHENLKSLKEFNFKIFPGVIPGWDNSARRKNDPTLLLDDSTPEEFETWLNKIDRDFVPYSTEENFVFINAWNEWAEGNHLEPCQRWGAQYLEKVKAVFDRS